MDLGKKTRSHDEAQREHEEREGDEPSTVARASARGLRVSTQHRAVRGSNQHERSGSIYSKREDRSALAEIDL
jgi:hypothetical protein